MIPEERRAARFPVPFMSTDTATDLALALVLLPLWWVLGIEQFVWAPLALLILAKRWIRGGRLEVERPVFYLGGAFALSYVISGFFIVEKIRYLTFLLNGATYLAAGIFLLLAADCARREQERLRVLWGIGGVALIAALIGFLPYLGLPLEFSSPVRFLIPEALQETFLVQLMIMRDLGGPTWLYECEVYRVRSIFFYTTTYAAALAIAIPIQVYLAAISRRWTRGLWAVAAILSLLNMTLTTTRAALLAFLGASGLIALLFLIRKLRSRVAPALVVIVLISGICGYLIVLSPQTMQTLVRSAGGCEVATETTPTETTPTETAPTETAQSIVAARGGSAQDRAAIYLNSIESWLQRPVFGWGTQRDVPGVYYPLGSHSMYLGTLYQRGAIGLAVLLAMIGYVLWRLLRGIRASGDWRSGLFLRFASVSLIAVTVAGLTEIFDVDVTVQVLYWTLWGLVIGTASAAERSVNESDSADKKV